MLVSGALRLSDAKVVNFGGFLQMVCLRGVAAMYWLVVVRWDCVC